MSLDTHRPETLRRTWLVPSTPDLFVEGTLERLLAAGPGTWQQVRRRLIEWLTCPAYRSELDEFPRHVLAHV